MVLFRRQTTGHRIILLSIGVVAFTQMRLIISAAASGSNTTATAPPTISTSLKGKTDQELIDLVTGHKSSVGQKKDAHDDNRVAPSPLDRLWEMDPRDAAIAFASDYAGENMKGIKFEIDDPDARPPKSGEVGLRWISGNEYAPVEHGITILKYEGYKSELLLSQVEIAGRASKSEIEAAIRKTDSHPVRRLIAQQTYEILWWLRHVRLDKQPSSFTSATYSSADGVGRFWMKPDGPTIEEARFGEPCGQCIVEKEHNTYDSFAAILIRLLIQRSGIKERYPVPTVGHYIDSDPDLIFLRSHPPPLTDKSETVEHWVSRLVRILRDPKRQYLYSTVLDALVPASDPQRYHDRRIDEVLLETFRRGNEAGSRLEKLRDVDDDDDFDPSKFKTEDAANRELQAREAKRKQRREEEHLASDLQLVGTEAAEKLGLRDAVDAFQELLRAAGEPEHFNSLFNEPLIAAALMAGRHPELRPRLIEFMRPQLSKAETGSSIPHSIFEAIWVADLRQVTPELSTLAKFAAAPNKDGNEDKQGGFDSARAILMAWRETDPLTKTKLDILLIGQVGHAITIPEALRAEFETLTKEDQMTVRNFVSWMRTVEVPWSRRYIENAFTPHTPRPDISFER